MRSSSVLSLAGAVVLGGLEAVLAQTPLVYKRFPYANVPYQVDTFNGDRGRQVRAPALASADAGTDGLQHVSVAFVACADTSQL